eukprot:TRINITY_DN110693_c0_g1_i1.p1 TRINITY_DN110693_c0_g1~~TRINITY_DN110693_c0_g1_i1.p1  ORF type:complete len:507 (+),score=141.40 TRINITY_DN110693_c0_g1_i1:72-1592(+)
MAVALPQSGSHAGTPSPPRLKSPAWASAGLLTVVALGGCRCSFTSWVSAWLPCQQRGASAADFLAARHAEISSHSRSSGDSAGSALLPGGVSTAVFAGVASIAVASAAASARRQSSGTSGSRCARSSRVASRAVAPNPAIGFPEGKPMRTTEYPAEYDLSDPKGSFTRVGEMILKELIEEMPGQYELPAKEVAWVSKSLEYNTQGGKMNRGLIVVETGRDLMSYMGKTPTSRDLHRFAVLGWAVEFLQACMLMADDMMDGSVTRRGNPCWYRLENVGLLNTNDFLMIEMFVYKILRRHFGDDEFYTWLLDLFVETTFQTEVGQLLDSLCVNCELEELTTDRWTLVVKYKTAFYSFYLPVALAMIATGVTDPKAYNTAREVLMLQGIYFQAQDDYLDAFACPEQLGKIGTDIADKKCSWLFAHAYHEHSTPEAKALLDASYGKCEVGSPEEEKIKDVYRELGLQELFGKYEQQTVDKLEAFKQQVEDVDLPWSIFERFFGMIKGRSK